MCLARAIRRDSLDVSIVSHPDEKMLMNNFRFGSLVGDNEEKIQHKFDLQI